jgi:hypothetical protein
MSRTRRLELDAVTWLGGWEPNLMNTSHKDYKHGRRKQDV